MRTRKLLSLFLAVLMVFTSAFVAAPVSADEGSDTADSAAAWRKIYTAEDLANEAGMAAKNLSFTTVEEGGKTYFRAYSETKQSNGINWTFTEALDPAKVKVILVSAKTNITPGAGNTGMKIQVSKTNAFAWDQFWTEKSEYSYSEDAVAGAVHSFAIELPAECTEIKYFRILPWNGYAVTLTDGTNVAKFDIEFVGFFESADEAAAFDYEEYLNPTLPEPTDDPTITVPAGAKPEQLSTLPYKNEEGGR